MSAERLRTLLDERLSGLSARIQEWLEESHARAGTLAEIIEQARSEPLLMEPELVAETTTGTPVPMRALAEFAQEVEASADQVAILGRLVDGAARQASRVVLFLVRGDSFAGWFARGLPSGINPRKMTIPQSTESLLGRAHRTCRSLAEGAEHHEANAEMTELLGGEPVEAMLAAPLWVRDRVAAILYADSAGDPDPWSPDAIRVMVSLTALSLEALPARSKFPRPIVQPALPELEEETPEAPAGHGAAPPAAPKGVATKRGKQEPQESKEPREPEPPDPEVTRAHDEARRFARLLVSEILLYNEGDIEEGRRNKDLYQRLKEDIDRSRQMYQRRITTALAAGPDYFRQELIRTLAAGDESALDLPWD